MENSARVGTADALLIQKRQVCRPHPRRAGLRLRSVHPLPLFSRQEAAPAHLPLAEEIPRPRLVSLRLSPIPHGSVRWPCAPPAFACPDGAPPLSSIPPEGYRSFSLASLAPPRCPKTPQDWLSNNTKQPATRFDTLPGSCSDRNEEPETVYHRQRTGDGPGNREEHIPPIPVFVPDASFPVGLAASHSFSPSLWHPLGNKWWVAQVSQPPAHVRPTQCWLLCWQTTTSKTKDTTLVCSVMAWNLLEIVAYDGRAQRKPQSRPTWPV
jgi:hypothetical protein